QFWHRTPFHWDRHSEVRESSGASPTQTDLTPDSLACRAPTPGLPQDDGLVGEVMRVQPCGHSVRDPPVSWSRFSRTGRRARLRRPVRPYAIGGNLDHEDVTGGPRECEGEVVGPGSRRDDRAVLRNRVDEVASLFPTSPYLPGHIPDLLLGYSAQVIATG